MAICRAIKIALKVRILHESERLSQDDRFIASKPNKLGEKQQYFSSQTDKDNESKQGEQSNIG